MLYVKWWYLKHYYRNSSPGTDIPMDSRSLGDLFSISKDCKLDSVNSDDFSTPADDEGKERLLQKEEEKKHR